MACVSVRRQLLERDGELAAVDSLIARVPDGDSSFVVVIGPAGIGKTRFLAAVDQHASRAGLVVLRARGAEFERGIGFGGAVQLFEAPIRAATDQQRRELLEGAAGLGGALLDSAPGASPTAREIPASPRFTACIGCA